MRINPARATHFAPDLFIASMYVASAASSSFVRNFPGFICIFGIPNSSARSKMLACSTSLITKVISACKMSFSQALASDTKFDPLPDPSMAIFVLELIISCPIVAWGKLNQVFG